MSDLNSTPRASRFAIGIFGRSNVGKSSLINALSGQNIALTSSVAGTTTDPVYKAMELHPLGPVVFMDTAGLDDQTELGRLRVGKSYEILRKCNLVLLVTDPETLIASFEKDFLKLLKDRSIPFILVVNQCDRTWPDSTKLTEMSKELEIPAVAVVSARSGLGLDELRRQIAAGAHAEEKEPGLLEGLVKEGDVVVLVTPIDSSAPKGRLILPQQQTIRDLLERKATIVVTEVDKLTHTLNELKNPPQLLITDSQAFRKVSGATPEEIPLTSFSILFARQKADLGDMLQGIRRIGQLAPGDKVLIVEGCTHHAQDDDIATVKIPRWIRQFAGEQIEFDWARGADLPAKLQEYALVVHCGGCMLNRREMLWRIGEIRRQGVPVTNYGTLIAHVMGILPRALKPFGLSAASSENR